MAKGLNEMRKTEVFKFLLIYATTIVGFYHLSMNELRTWFVYYMMVAGVISVLLLLVSAIKKTSPKILHLLYVLGSVYVSIVYDGVI